MNDTDDQREFLLRSLEDLEREHDAGDLDDADYVALKDDYTARAAAALRAERPTDLTARRPGNRRFLVLAAVLAFAVLAGVLVARSAGRRDAGDSATGSVAQSITEKLNEARRCFEEGDADCAVGLYDEVLEQQPSNAEALAYKGWLSYRLLGERGEALELLVDAATADPEYPAAHAFLAAVFFRSGLVQQASAALARLDELDPPPDVLEQIEGLRQEVEAAMAALATSTSAG